MLHSLLLNGLTNLTCLARQRLAEFHSYIVCMHPNGLIMNHYAGLERVPWHKTLFISLDVKNSRKMICGNWQ